MNPIYDIKRLLTAKKTLLVLLFCFCFGVALAVITNTSKDKSEKKEILHPVITNEQNTERNVESELENTLKKVNGVGDVEVMIIYASSDEKILAKDIDSQGSEKTVNRSESATNEPYIVKTKLAEVEGVIVVAKGGGNINVKNMLIDCISDTLSIPAYKVKILEMN